MRIALLCCSVFASCHDVGIKFVYSINRIPTAASGPPTSRAEISSLGQMLRLDVL